MSDQRSGTGAPWRGSPAPVGLRDPRAQSAAILFVLLLTALPLLWPTIPPLVDLPNHMSRYAIAAQYDTSPYFRGWYDYHWRFVGNLGVDIPAIFLAKLIGVEHATKIVMIAVPLIAVGGMIWLSRLIHGTITLGVPLAAMFAYNYPFNYGFVNFVLAAALCLPALALWVALGQQKRLVLRGALFIPLALVIWIAHAVGWGIFGLMVFGYEFAVNREAGDTLVRAAIRAAVSCLVLCLPLLPMLWWYATAMQGAATSARFRINRKIAYVVLALRNYNPIADAAATLGAAAIVAIGYLGRGLVFDRRLLFPGLVIAAVYMLLPDDLLGSGYADLRIIPYGLILLLLSVAPVRASRLMTLCRYGAFLLFAVRTAYVTTTYAWLGNKYDRELAALSLVPTGAKLFGAARVVCFKDWHDDRLDHLHRIATVRRQAFTNSTWPPVASQTLSVRPRMLAGYSDLDSQRIEPIGCRIHPYQTIDGSVAQLPGSPFDYYWLMGVAPQDWPRRPWLRQIWHSEDAVLYRIDHAHAPPAEAPGRDGRAT